MQARVPPRVHHAVRVLRARNRGEGDVPHVPSPVDGGSATLGPYPGAARRRRRHVRRGDEARRAPLKIHLVPHRSEQVHEQHEGGGVAARPARDARRGPDARDDGARARRAEQSHRFQPVHEHDRDRRVALEEGELRDRQAARLHARHAARRESARVSRGPERDGDSDEPQIRRRGFEPADGEPGLRARAVVESRGGDAGGDARAPDRADAAGDRDAILHRGYHRGEDVRPAKEKGARLRGVHGRQPGVTRAAHGGRSSVSVQTLITRRGGEERCPRAIETANAFDGSTRYGSR
mmetsp:Transcript_5181/g.20879  ORF Transcript_5181/g.20879 Transcript_5181/m.20879 type:complete len:294 (-) Transcript_5181:50-931(-)